MQEEESQKEEPSIKEQRIKSIMQLYYSRPDIQEAIYKFSKDREIVPSYMMEGFGKRPDSLQYKSDIFQMVKKGATSFHCSEELWNNPLAISTELNEKQLNEIRKGWDFIMDIDSKYLDYSKILAKQIISFLEFHGIKNIGLKFSGSKGFHILIPWEAFPKEINEIKTSDMFPEWPRIILKYISEKTKPQLIKEITKLTSKSKYVKDENSAKEVMPDLVLVSSRHLFRMPYSLHEKTGLASAVISPEELENFQPKNAAPLKIKIKNFMPNAVKDEAKELLVHALDWYKDKNIEKDFSSFSEKIQKDFKPIKLDNLSEKNFPPSIQKILAGLSDGKKRGLFILINFFRAVGVEKEELEQRIYSWNGKNETPLKKGYIQSQLLWSYRNKPIPPPNFDKDYYKGIGIVPSQEELKFKNPVSYTIKKSLQENFKNSNKFKKNN